MSLLLNLAYWIPYQHSSSETILIYSFHLSPSWLITLLVMALFQVLSKGLLSPPLIKKASLPKNDLKNYCPVSGLCFLSKLVERVVAKQLRHTSISTNVFDFSSPVSIAIFYTPTRSYTPYWAYRANQWGLNLLLVRLQLILDIVYCLTTA